MTVHAYDRARLVPKTIYASKARDVLGAARSLMSEMSDPLPVRLELDAALHGLAAGQQVAAADLFSMLRVALAWPLATPDLFEVMRDLGRNEVLARLDRALVMLNDVA